MLNFVPPLLTVIMSKGFVNIKYLAIGLTLGKDHHVLCETATVKGDDAAFAASVKQVIAGID